MIKEQISENIKRFN